MIKKFFNVLMCLIMSLNCIMITTTVAADEATTVVGNELFTNGGFENVRIGSPSGWGIYPNDGWGTSYIKLEQNEVHSGSYAARIDGGEGKKPTSIIMQGVNNLIPKGKYRLSFWVYLDSTDSAFTINTYYEEANVYRGLSSVYPDNVNGWTYVERDVIVEESSVRIQFQFKGIANEYVIIDDASFSLLELPPKYKLELRDIFNYSDNETGSASLGIYDYFYDVNEANLTKVNFSITNTDGNVIVSQNDVSIDAYGKAEFNYSLSDMHIKEKYSLNATVYVDGVEKETLSKNVYKYNRPSNLRADGIYTIDGEPFVPVIAYGAKEADYARLKEIGVNTVHVLGYGVDYVQPKLELCEQYGLKAMIDLGVLLKEQGYKYASQYKIWAEELVKATKDNPVVLAYTQMDEPKLDDETLGVLEQWYAMVRNIDDEHPVYLCQYDRSADVYATMEKYCDILAEDNYPYQDDNSSKTTYVKNAIEQSRKPVYSVLQVFEGQDYFPTAEHIRQQMYRALEEGAKGIAYFSMSATSDSKLWETDRWEGMKKSHSAEQSLVFDYFILGKHSTVNKLDEEGPYGFYSASWCVGDNLYLVVHNRSNSSVEREISLNNGDGEPFVNCRILNVNEETETTTALSKMTVNLDPQEVDFYEITPVSMTGFGRHASFVGIDAGEVTKATGYEVIDGYDTVQAKNYHVTLQNVSVKSEQSGGADGDGSYIEFGAGITYATKQPLLGNEDANVRMRSKVEAGKNYTISFYSKTSISKDLLVAVRYLVDNDGLRNWHSTGRHECFKNGIPDSHILNDQTLKYTHHTINSFSALNGGGYYEGHQVMYVGSQEATTDWVKNEIEIHVPHHAAAVEIDIWRNNESTTAPCVDDFDIVEEDTNLVVNGDFEKSISYASATKVMSRDSYFSSGFCPSSWIVQKRDNSTGNAMGSITKVTENGNTYYKATPNADTTARQGHEFAQGVWLEKGNYKLKFKWRSFELPGRGNYVFVSLRRGTADGATSVQSYYGDTAGKYIEAGLTPAFAAMDLTAAHGSTLAPTYGLGQGQTVEDGWVDYEVYFTIDEARAYWLGIGDTDWKGTFAIDDVVLLPVSEDEKGIDLTCIGNAEVVNEDLTTERYVKTGTTEIQNSEKKYIGYAKTTAGEQRKVSGVLKAINPTGDMSGILITAVYETNNQTGNTTLYSVDSNEFSASQGKVTLAALQSPLQVPADTDALTYTVKSFVWNSFGDLRPLISGVTE